MMLARMARNWGSIPHRDTKLLTYCDIGGQCELRARSVFKKYEDMLSPLRGECSCVFVV